MGGVYEEIFPLMAKANVTLDEFARQDVDAISEWYEKDSLPLRRRFTSELNKAFRKIQQFPNAFPAVYKDFRKVILNNFPYLIIYRVKPDEIVVYAVTHMSRNPTSWLVRIQ
jgi:toxin ParE1/3/4